MTDLPACREAFEKYGYDKFLTTSMLRVGDKYCGDAVNDAWDLWQAAWNTLNPSVDVETLKALVERWRKSAKSWEVNGFFARASACTLHADELEATIKRGEG